MSSVRCNRNKERRILSFLMMLCLCVSVFSSALLPTSAASLEEQRDALKKQQKQLQSQINSLKSDAGKKQQYKSALQNQVSTTRSQISNYNQSIKNVDREINKVATELAEKEDELTGLKKEFKTRIRTISMNGGDVGSTAVSLLLGAEDFGEILAMAEYTKNVAARDTKIMDGITEAMASIKKNQSELESKRKALESYKTELESSEKALKSQMTELNSVLASLNEKQQDLKKEYADAEAKIAKLENEIAEAARRAGKQDQESGVAFTSGFIWPLPGKKSDYRLTSAFNLNRMHPVYGYRSPHTGMDYSKGGIAGTPIYAAADGTVSVATYQDGGYGYYVMISHGIKDGKSYSTLYAHMTRYVVSQGQKVKQGQLIGYVGSSGAATGPHLHIGLFLNGTAVDPAPYFS